MESILKKITDRTKEDLKRIKREITFRELESFDFYDVPRRDFTSALDSEGFTVIAEIKKASPSKGVIRADFDPVRFADEYIGAGAAALSILTDKPFFKGDLNYLKQVAGSFDIPLLRKDFIVDPYQVKEARAYGADAVLIIVSITSDDQLKELLHACNEFGLQTLVECYSREDVERIDWQEVSVFGVNNRDLNTFDVNLHRGVELLQLSPDTTIRVSESGLSSSEDLFFLMENGIHSALIGEYFMRQPSPGKALVEMLSGLEKLRLTHEQ